MSKKDTLSAIKRHAKEQGLTVRALCALAGVDYVTFWRWTQSSSVPRQATVDKLLAVRK